MEIQKIIKKGALKDPISHGDKVPKATIQAIKARNQRYGGGGGLRAGAEILPSVRRATGSARQNIFLKIELKTQIFCLILSTILSDCP